MREIFYVYDLQIIPAWLSLLQALAYRFLGSRRHFFKIYPTYGCVLSNLGFESTVTGRWLLVSPVGHPRSIRKIYLTLDNACS